MLLDLATDSTVSTSKIILYQEDSTVSRSIRYFFTFGQSTKTSQELTISRYRGFTLRCNAIKKNRHSTSQLSLHKEWGGGGGGEHYSVQKKNTCTNVVKTSSSDCCKNWIAQSSTRPKAVFCLSASSKIELRYRNLCHIFCTLANLNSISVSLIPCNV